MRPRPGCAGPRCLLSRPWGAVGFVFGVALAADAALPLTGHETASVHLGRHLKVALGILVGLALHFASGQLGLGRFDPLRWLRRSLRRSLLPTTIGATIAPAAAGESCTRRR